MSGETTGPREIDRALLALDESVAPCFLLCFPASTYYYPLPPDEVWLCKPGGETLEAARAAAARENGDGRGWILIVERISVRGEDWPASDRPCVTDYRLRKGSWLVLVPSARIVPSWVSFEACLVTRVAHAGEDEVSALGALAAESARALLGRVRMIESLVCGAEPPWLQNTATATEGRWNF